MVIVKVSLLVPLAILSTLLLIIAEEVAVVAATTRITSYQVQTRIQTRFAKSTIKIDFVNDERTCSVQYGMTIQLPFTARVTNLDMKLSDGCELSSNVEEEELAQYIYDESASSGKPAALLQAWDAANYGLDISIPPSGTTHVEIQYEELLKRRNGAIDLEIVVTT